MWEIGRMICLGYLAGLSAADIRYRKLPALLLAAGGISAAGYAVFAFERSFFTCLAGFGIGVVFIGVSYVTREAIGYGDGVTLCILGLYVGAEKLIEILLIAWAALTVSIFVRFARKGISRKTVFPFIPFVTAGYILVFASELCQAPR